MNRRTLVAKGGASALALTVAGLAANRAVDAQDATPVPGTETPSTGEAGTTETRENSSVEKYQEFLTALAANLGVADAATVDTAIKTTLKGMIDAEFNDGNISANEATARKEAIDAAEAPIRFSGGSRGGMMSGDHRGGSMRGGPGERGTTPGGTLPKPGDSSDESDDASPGTEATPTSTV